MKINKRWLIINLLLVFLLICGCAHLKPQLPEAEGQSQVTVKLVKRGEPVYGAVVYFYPKTIDGFTEKPALSSPFTDRKGKATLKIKSGSYYLIALKKKNPHRYLQAEPGDLYCFYGGNPVFFAPGETSKVGLNMVEVKQAKQVTDPPKLVGTNSGVRGQVTFQDKPLGGADIYVYLDGKTHFRGPGSLELLEIGPDGKFNIELPEGSYYLIGKKRSSGNWAGPLQQGDYFCFYPQNPLSVEAGKISEIELECISKTRPRKRKASTFIKTGTTAATGTIRSPGGKPVAGAFAFAYKNRAMNGRRPPYISRQTGPDGRYVLNFSEGGRYYIGARNNSGGPPMPGEFYGEYDGNPDHVIELKNGEVQINIDINLKEME